MPGAGIDRKWGIDGSKTAVSGDRGFPRDHAGLSDAGRAASAETAAAQRSIAATADHPAAPRRRKARPARRGAARAGGRVPKNVPRVQITAPRVEGSISLLGARLDDLVLTRLPRDDRPELAAGPPAGAAVRRSSLLRPIWLDRAGRARPSSCRATTPSGPRRRHDADAGQAGHAVLGQRRGPDLPDRLVDRRRLHVHRPPDA